MEDSNEPTPVDATELINDLALQIAQLTVTVSALRIENRALKAAKVA